MASTATYGTPTSGSAFGRGDSQYLEHAINVVCDATPSAVPDLLIPSNNTTGGEIAAIGVKMPHTGYPNSVTVTIKDQHGITIFTGAVTGGADVASRLYLSDGLNDGRSSFIGPITVSHSGNTTASATWSTYVLVN